MKREEGKEQYEKDILMRFLNQVESQIEIDSIRHGDHIKNEPDFLCGEGLDDSVAFELGRLTSSTLKAVQHSRDPEPYGYLRSNDYAIKTTRKKLKRQYSVTCPVELLLYVESPTTLPESYMFERIESMAKSINHCYREVWFMGNETKNAYSAS